MEDMSKGINLNENPAVPDTSGIGNVLMNKNNAAPTVTIGNLIIKSTPNSNQLPSAEDEINRAYKDTAL